jgi:hypothetical protein
MKAKLFTIGDSNPKTAKSAKLGYLTFVLHFAPWNLSGFQACPVATASECWGPCLNLAGRGGIFKAGESTNNIQAARIRRTKFFFEDRAAFMAALYKEIQAGIRYARKLGLIPVFRLNGTSDIPWEKIRFSIDGREYRNVMAAFPDVQFYDYTKIPGRTTPANYAVTFSRSARNELNVIKALAAGQNVAAVFDHARPFPSEFMGRPVIDGDEHDLRFLDPAGAIVALKAKGPARRDNSGFVVRGAA